MSQLMASLVTPPKYLLVSIQVAQGNYLFAPGGNHKDSLQLRNIFSWKGQEMGIAPIAPVSCCYLYGNPSPHLSLLPTAFPFLSSSIRLIADLVFLFTSYTISLPLLQTPWTHHSPGHPDVNPLIIPRHSVPLRPPSPYSNVAPYSVFR